MPPVRMHLVPVTTDLAIPGSLPPVQDNRPKLEALLLERERTRAQLEQASAMLDGDPLGLVAIFAKANAEGDFTTDSLFKLDPAVRVLDASLWSRALDLTDARSLMCAEDNKTWRDRISNPHPEWGPDGYQPGGGKGKYAEAWPGCPPFTPETVIPTIAALIGDRARLFARRVEGVYHSLSGDHKTNSPTGFRKKMIITGMLAGTKEHQYPSTSGAAQIHDLRCVIATIQRRPHPPLNTSSKIIGHSFDLRCGGESNAVEVDGGEIRLAIFMNGNAHVWIGDELALELNEHLARLHPMAIPPKHRASTAPRKARKGRPLRQVTLAGEARQQLLDIDTLSRDKGKFRGSPGGVRRLHPDAVEAVEIVGGRVEFGYLVWLDCPSQLDALHGIAVRGCLPEKRSHQAYRTLDSLARQVSELAEISHGPLGHRCLEPSAGFGALVRHMNVQATVCVDIDPLACDMLDRSFGGVEVDAIHCGDFLGMERERLGLFERVVMNPPFDKGMWRRHVEHAVSLLECDGRLVAIVPASATIESLRLPADARAELSPPQLERFDGCEVEIRMLVVVRDY